MFFSVITKNSNWENLTKNLVIFKRSNWVKDEKLEYFWGSRENCRIFRGGHKKPILRGELPKKGCRDVLQI